MLEPSTWQMQIGGTCDKLMQNNVSYLTNTNRHNLTCQMPKRQPIVDHNGGMTTQSCSAYPKRVPSHTSMTGRGCTSRSSRSCRCLGMRSEVSRHQDNCYHFDIVSSAFLPSHHPTIVEDSLVQRADATGALVRTGRLYCAAQARGNNVCRCLSVSEVFMYTRKRTLTALTTLPFE